MSRDTPASDDATELLKLLRDLEWTQPPYQRCADCGSYRNPGVHASKCRLAGTIARLKAKLAVPSDRPAAPMTLGSSDALDIIEAMGKALEPFAVPQPFADLGRVASPEELRRARDALAAFRAWRAGGGGG